MTSFDGRKMAERLRASRIARGLGLRELARLAGVAPATLSRAERGVGSMRAEHVVAVADVLMESTDYLLTGLVRRP